jgi:hypothetical protein
MAVCVSVQYRVVATTNNHTLGLSFRRVDGHTRRFSLYSLERRSRRAAVCQTLCRRWSWLIAVLHPASLVLT